ncbi:MAG: alcohol dehydrogenase catalytic domain-containing protein [Verrucomicrobiales bacterium]|nr:alcohol dehydrogenase catalytic domain-containing protein [Verrucomicrobiales bacterium]
MTTLARSIIALGDGSFELTDLQVAEDPGVDEVLVRIRAAGICHTDYDSLNWGKAIVMGHEGAGEVVAVGDNVTEVAAGDRVVLNWAISCGECFQCQRGNFAICEKHSPVASPTPLGGHARVEATLRSNGQPIERSFNIGTMSELTMVRKEAVVKIPQGNDISYEAACIIGCGVMTGYGSVVNAAKVEAGSSVVVIGCGGVGLNVIQGARIAGARRIIALDLSAERLVMAQQFGATHVIQTQRDDVGLLRAAAEVRVLTETRGADYAFEATAVPALGAAPLAMIRNAGTAVQVSGIEEDLTIDMNLFEWDKTYLNPLYGLCNAPVDFPKMLELYQQGDLLLDEMITRTYSLHQLGEAFADMRAGRNAKGVITMDD